MRKCIVCNFEMESGTKKCSQCGFSISIPRFLNEKQYSHWFEIYVIPYRTEWEETKRKAEEERKKAEEAKRKAEEERRKAEEAKRKAEEEERRKAEEAKRKEEEERRKAERARRKENLQKDSGCLGAAGIGFEVYVKENGTVYFCNQNYSTADLKNAVEKWKDIQSVAAGNFHVIGLKKNGNVVAAGRNHLGQCEVSEWKRIRQITAAGDCSAAVDESGNVFVCGGNDYPVMEARNWKDIAQICLAEHHILGLKKDGTVVAAGSNEDDQCEITDWKSIKSIAAGSYHSVGLKEDGTVIAAGIGLEGECQVADWSKIRCVQAGQGITYAVTESGTILATREDSHINQEKVSDYMDLQSDKINFINVVAGSKGLVAAAVIADPANNMNIQTIHVTSKGQGLEKIM